MRHLYGWGRRIRTFPYGFRVRCPTARRFPNAPEIISLRRESGNIRDWFFLRGGDEASSLTPLLSGGLIPCLIICGEGKVSARDCHARLRRARNDGVGQGAMARASILSMGRYMREIGRLKSRLLAMTLSYLTVMGLVFILNY